MTQAIQGIHHITAFAGDPQKNIDFYTQVLGQRLVKTTVNFDDPGTYHFYYGDKLGTPGTILTFFPWPHAKRGRRGVGEVAATAYTISPDALDYWENSLTVDEIPFSTSERFGAKVLTLTDPDGMHVELVVEKSDFEPVHWENGPASPKQALHGFHGVTIWVQDYGATAALLTDIFGYEDMGEENTRRRFKAPGSHGRYVDLVLRPDLGRGAMGAGSIHHVAFRAKNDDEQLQWREKIAGTGLGVTDVKDRQYFHSIYFREPSGTLFEIATDAPGFATDEPVAELGRDLKLPPWLEPQRPQIEKALPPHSGAGV